MGSSGKPDASNGRPTLWRAGGVIMVVLNIMVLRVLWGQGSELHNCHHPMSSQQSLHFEPLGNVPPPHSMHQPPLTSSLLATTAISDGSSAMAVSKHQGREYANETASAGGGRGDGWLKNDVQRGAEEDEEHDTDESRRTRNVIAVLTDSFGEELRGLIRNVDKHFIDNATTALLVFHTGYPLDEEAEQLAALTVRPIEYHNVDQQFTTFPHGFDPYKEKAPFVRPPRGKWNYSLMIRFWFKGVFELPCLRDVRYLMRLDLDSRLTGPWVDVFGTMDRQQAVYWANQVIYDVEWTTPGIVKLSEFSQHYYRQHELVAANMAVWNATFAEQGRSIRGYFNNFEINRVSFFRRPEVLEWVQAVDDSLGIFRHRWGDALLRHMTLAFFARSREVLEIDWDWKLPYCHPWPFTCPEVTE